MGTVGHCGARWGCCKGNAPVRCPPQEWSPVTFWSVNREALCLRPLCAPHTLCSGNPAPVACKTHSAGLSPRRIVPHPLSGGADPGATAATKRSLSLDGAGSGAGDARAAGFAAAGSAWGRLRVAFAGPPPHPLRPPVLVTVLRVARSLPNPGAPHRRLPPSPPSGSSVADSPDAAVPMLLLLCCVAACPGTAVFSTGLCCARQPSTVLLPKAVCE